MAKRATKKRAYGKGLDALLTNIKQEVDAGNEAAVKEDVKELANTVATIPVASVEVNPFQPRNKFDETALEELAASLKIHGLIQPITVRSMGDGKYQLISGERRLRASKIAGLTDVPAYIRVVENDQEMIEMALIENIQRQDLNAIEIAISYQRMIDECKLTHEQMSERVSKKRETITNYLRLLKLPPEIQQALKNKMIAMGHARVLAGVNDLALQLSLFQQALSQSLSVRKLEQLASDAKNPKPKAEAKSAQALGDEYKEVQNKLRSFLGTKIKLKVDEKGAGQIHINFGSTEELNRILDLIED